MMGLGLSRALARVKSTNQWSTKKERWNSAQQRRGWGIRGGVRRRRKWPPALHSEREREKTDQIELLSLSLTLSLSLPLPPSYPGLVVEDAGASLSNPPNPISSIYSFDRPSSPCFCNQSVLALVALVLVLVLVLRWWWWWCILITVRILGGGGKDIRRRRR